MVMIDCVLICYNNTLRPIGLCSVISLVFIGLGVGYMEKINHFTEERFALNQVWLTYGKMRHLCTVSFKNPYAKIFLYYYLKDKFPYEADMYPSFLRQVEIKVLTNIFYRVAVCVPMAVRIFIAMIVRYVNVYLWL